MSKKTPAKGPICPEDLEHLRHEFEANPLNRLAMNAVCKTPITQVALNRSVVTRTNHTFSHMVRTGAATSQGRSGRCWLFAALNTLRVLAADQMSLEDFEFSQNYLMFWDKLEKANYFLESILKTLDEPTDSRLISWILQSPIQDGGQWDMFVNLVKKYGLIPKSVMPETESSSNTWAMNHYITTKLREDAYELRKAHKKGAKEANLRQRKTEMVSEVYRMLCIHLGVPPQEFLWQWRDREREFHRDGVITPHEFLRRHVPVDLDEKVCLIHCPILDYNKLYTIEYLGNVLEGHIVRYLNVELPVLKKATVAMVKDGKPVWFGCDVGKYLDRDLGLMDLELHDVESLYGVSFRMDKATRLNYGHSQMTHAMVFTGVDLDEKDKPRKWRVENSWGEQGGDRGFMVMTDPWFDEYTYEVVVDKQYVDPKTLKLLETKPVSLPPWHPMGSLARS